jgi:uncharacterized protein
MSEFNSEITSDDKLWAALAYVFSPLVPIILMLMEDKKNRPFLKAHMAQALILGIITMLLYGACGLGLLVLIYQLFLAYKSYQGEYVEIPVITNFVKGQGWA